MGSAPKPIGTLGSSAWALWVGYHLLTIDRVRAANAVMFTIPPFPA